MRRESFHRERSFSNLKSRSSWGSFTNLVQRGEDQPLLGEADEFPEPGYTVPLLLSCCVALMSAFQFGYNTGVTGALNPVRLFPTFLSPTLVLLEHASNRVSNHLDFPNFLGANVSISPYLWSHHQDLVFPGHSDLEWAVCVSIFAVGGPIGSLTAGRMSTALGRKKALIVDSFLFVLAGAIMAFAANIYMLIAGRFIVGYAAGTVSVVVPLYLGELAPPNLRGALGTGYQFGVVTGILAASLLAFGFSGPSNGLAQPGWRFLMGFTIAPAVLQMALSSWLTESPRWLLTKNKPKEAADILRRLRGSNDVYEEIDSICSASDNESGDMGFWAVLTDRSIRFPLLVGVVLQIAQQFSGINAVMFYANSFFKNVGLANPLVGTTLVQIVNVISTGVALVLMDTAGRRPLLVYSTVGMIFSTVVLTLALLKLLPFAGMVSVGGVMCFVWFFEIGLGPIPWLIVAEMFPARPRPTAMSIATMVNWVCSFIVGLVFPTLQSSLNEYSFVPFGTSLVLALVFVLKYVPETKGKTTAEIQDDMRKIQ
jgi:MFS transporter, SP family, solute carrier family 2 (facilitated glucose transporter), member 3